jgi:hypothetical protein
MNDDRDPLTHLLDGLAPPLPPAHLESRVLRAARAAMARDRSRDGWARAWESPAWRLAWAAALAVLIAGHAALSLRSPAGPGVAGPPAAAPSAAAGGELAAVGGLLRLDVDARPLVGIVHEQPAEAPVPRRTNPRGEIDKETRS